MQRILQAYKSLQDIIAILGMDELSEEDKLIVARIENTTILYNLSLLKYLQAHQVN